MGKPDDSIQLVIEDLALSEAELLECVVMLEGDVAIYRELVCAAFDALHDLTVELHRERDQHHQLRQEYRGVLERVMLGMAA